MRPAVYRASQTGVILAAIACIGWQIVQWQPALQLEDDESERNERSTPRALVLPPTPAIAELYEKFDAENAHPGRERACLLRLRDMGYPIDELQTAFNAKFVEALMRYQNAHKLPVNGRLDAITMEMLGCN